MRQPTIAPAWPGRDSAPIDSQVIWRASTEHAWAEVWHQPVSSGGARFAIIALRRGAPLRTLYQAYVAECDCSYETYDFAAGDKDAEGRYRPLPKIRLPRMVCRRGVMVPAGGGVYPMNRGGCTEGNQENYSRSAREHRQRYCHGGYWDGSIRLHREHAIEAAEAVLASYEPKNRKPLRRTMTSSALPGSVKSACKLAGIDLAEFERQLAVARAERAGAR